MAGGVRVGRRSYSGSFFAAYFFYYAGYCVFSSFIVPYLTQRGVSATLCGIITSLTLAANLLMEPAGGYITDTFCSTQRYLLACIGLISILCLFSTLWADYPLVCMALLILEAGLAYPFSQLMDAWVEGSRSLDPDLVYSRVRAGGSVGFAAASMAAGYCFRRFGWDGYFLMQAALFCLMIPWLLRLPKLKLGNQRQKCQAEQWLSPKTAFQVALRNIRYLVCLLLCTLYWFSHRPVGSYLSLIIQERSGDAGVYGAVCGVGAAVECAALLVLATAQFRHPISNWLCLGGALCTGLLRPLCLWLLPGLWPLYLGQGLQSISFAFFYSGSVACFTRTSDARIRSFSISMGLTVSSVVGTIAANLLGGWLCDWLGAWSMVNLSLAVSAGNGGLFLICWYLLLRDDRAG